MLVGYEDARFSAMLCGYRAGKWLVANPRFEGGRQACISLRGCLPNGAAGKRLSSYVQYALSVNSSDGIVTTTILASRASDHRYA
jgi:hypothetical protein